MPKVVLPQTYVGASLDKSMNPMLTSGFPRLTGVDLREGGSLRRFPGFKRNDLPPQALRDLDGDEGKALLIEFFQYVEIQKGTTDGKYRGFVVCHGVTSSTLILTYYYYDTDSAAYGSATLVSSSAILPGTIDITSAGKYLYFTYAVSGPTWNQKVFWYDDVGVAPGNANEVEELGVQTLDNVMTFTVTQPNASTGGLLVAEAEYVLGYRYVNSQRNVKTGMTVLQTLTAGGVSPASTSRFIISNNAHITTPPSNWATADTQVELYRSVAGGGNLRLEQTFTYVLPASTNWAWGDATNGVSDEQLVLQEKWDPLLDAVGVPPGTDRIAHYQGVTVMRLRGNTIDESNTDLVFSPAHDDRPEDFPLDQAYRVQSDFGPVLQFIQAGDFLFAFTAVGIIRFHKNGTQMEVNTFHYGWGPTSRYGSVAVGSSALVCTTKGLYVINGGDGTIDLIGSVERLITHDTEGWISDIEGDRLSSSEDRGTDDPYNIQVTHDEALGAVFITNTVKRQCIVFWTANGRVSMLENFPFIFSTIGPDPVNGGPRRAWFYGISDETGNLSPIYGKRNVYTVDFNRDCLTRTMLGLEGQSTLNFSALSYDGASAATGTDIALDYDCLGANLQFAQKNADGTFTPTHDDENGPSLLVLGSDRNYDLVGRADAASLSGGTTAWTEHETANEYTVSDNHITSSHDSDTIFNWASFDDPGNIDATDSDNTPYEFHAFCAGNGLVCLMAHMVGTGTDETALDGFLLAWNMNSSTPTRIPNGGAGQLIGADSLMLFQIDGGVFTQIGSTVSLGGNIADADVQNECVLRLRINSDNGSTISISGWINNVKHIEDTAFARTISTTTGKMGIHMRDHGTTAPKIRKIAHVVDPGRIVPSSNHDLSSGSANRLSVAPIVFGVTNPRFGGQPQAASFIRTGIEVVEAYLSNLRAPGADINDDFHTADTGNQKLLMQSFVEGSTVSEVAKEADVAGAPTIPAAHVSSAGLGIQAGIWHGGSDEDFELVATQIHGTIGDTTEDA